MLVAQLDRVTGYEPVGRGFESLQARQAPNVRTQTRGSENLNRVFAFHSVYKSFHIQSAPTTAEALLFLLHMLLMISIITEIAAAKVGKGHI